MKRTKRKEQVNDSIMRDLLFTMFGLCMGVLGILFWNSSILFYYTVYTPTFICLFVIFSMKLPKLWLYDYFGNAIRTSVAMRPQVFVVSKQQEFDFTEPEKTKARYIKMKTREEFIKENMKQLESNYAAQNITEFLMFCEEEYEDYCKTDKKWYK